VCPTHPSGPSGGLAVNAIKLVLVALLSSVALTGCHTFDSGSQGATPQPSSAQGPGTATLSWEAPTTTTSGGALTDLAGYRIYYGLKAEDLTQTVQLAGVGVQTYMIENLGQGTWYFAIKAVTNAGIESALSNIVSKTIG
jgi:hypothetical protein